LESQIKRLTTVNLNLRKEIALVKARYQTLNDAKTAVELQLEMARQAAIKAEEQFRCKEEQLQCKEQQGDRVEANDERMKKEESEDNAANKPRYTLKELRTVIADRNTWKMKAEELQEQVDWLTSRLSPDIDWPEEEDGLERTKVIPPFDKKQRTSTLPSRKNGNTLVESMEMRQLRGNRVDDTDGKESGVKSIFQTVGKVGVNNDAKMT
jgi:predicted nuclease with TOPRIM domain